MINKILYLNLIADFPRPPPPPPPTPFYKTWIVCVIILFKFRVQWKTNTVTWRKGFFITSSFFTKVQIVLFTELQYS